MIKENNSGLDQRKKTSYLVRIDTNDTQSFQKYLEDNFIEYKIHSLFHSIFFIYTDRESLIAMKLALNILEYMKNPST